MEIYLEDTNGILLTRIKINTSILSFITKIFILFFYFKFYSIMKKICFILFSIFYSTSLFSQDLETILIETITSSSVNFDNIDILRRRKKETLALLKKYYRDEDMDKIRGAFDLRFYLAENTQEKVELLDFYTTTLLDTDSGADGIIIMNLRNVNRSDYSEKAINNLINVVNSGKINAYNDDLIGIIGRIELREAIPYFKNKLSKVDKTKIPPRGNDWAMYLALARMGDKEAISFCEEKFNIYINSKRSGSYITDMAYMNNQKSIELFIKMLSINDVIDYGKDVGSEPLCNKGYTMICKMLGNVPIECKLESSYPVITQDKIQKLQTWVKAQPLESFKILKE
jgi:hypothetical protein